MRTLVTGWIAVIGLCVGSFLTVVTSRVPLGGSILAPPSSCPSCGAAIRWYDNIPVVSWILLRGRCRRCRTTIPLRYPALELVVGMVFGVIAAFARPLHVPVLLAAAAGLIATFAALGIHRRFPARIASVSATLVLLIAGATGVVGLLASS